ncbi:MAG TPA: aldo/keto reductase [Thermoanaerobaculia bacterium]|jgi:aryl-alcohol dehydrogenase-like predicted oxidoreductase|nr:aldo/keto reductase [Thermoanaerobaculia bacterium]
MITRRLALQLGLGATAAAFVSDPLRAKTDSKELVTRPIPSSGEKLLLIGIGTARRFDVSAATDKEPLREVLRALPRLGGRLVDTAPSYGVAESVVGELVEEIGNRDALFLATKVGAGRNGAEAGLAEMNASLQRLKRIDLLQIHNLAGVDVMLPILREWKDAKRIRYHGISTSSDKQYADLEAIMKREKLDFIQIDYALDNRLAEDRILPLAADRGIAVLTNLPFGRGRVLTAFKDKPVPDWAKELRIDTWAQFALKYVVSHPAVTSAIPGTAKLTYLEDNLGTARGPLPDAATRKKMVALLG